MEEIAERFFRLLEATRTVPWEFDLGTNRFVYMGKQAEDIFGYPDTSWTDFKSWKERLHPEDREKAAAFCLEATAEGRDHEFVYRSLRADGQTVWILNVVTVVKGPGGAERLVGFMHDITVSMRAENFLKESEESFRQIFLQSDDATFLLDPEGYGVIDANPAALHTYGQSRESLLSEGLTLFMPGNGLREFKERVRASAPGAVINIDQILHRKKDGTSVIVSARCQVIGLRRGRVLYCSFRDITEKIRAKEESMMAQAKLIHTNKMTSLGMLVSSVAHEINNPNNYIMFNAPLIAEAWRGVAPLCEERYRQEGDFVVVGLPYSEMRGVIPKLIEGVDEGARRIKEIVADLKDFARPGKVSLAESFQVNVACRAALRLLENPLRRLDLRLSLGKGLPPVQGSRQQIEQVLINLILNALESFSGEGGTLRLATGLQPSTGWVKVTIGDDGCGMSAEVLRKAREPFFSTRLEEGGTGLGLAISNSIVRDHGGEMEISSREGQGTEISILLPPGGKDSSPSGGEQ